MSKLWYSLAAYATLFMNKFYLTTGISGTDYTIDDGKSWKAINSRSFNSIGVSKLDGSCFMVGDKGVIAKIRVR